MIREDKFEEEKIKCTVPVIEWKAPVKSEVVRYVLVETKLKVDNFIGNVGYSSKYSKIRGFD